MDAHQLKIAYAASLLRNDGDPYKAAFAIIDNAGHALQIGKNWPSDPVVLAEQKRILTSTDVKAFLPSKEQQSRDIYTMATNEKLEVEDRLKAHRLYAEIMGHIEKPVPGGNVNILTQGVMIVRDAGTDDEWQEKATHQQQTLVANGSIN